MAKRKGEPVHVSTDLLRRVDELVELLGFGSREAFVESAVRRLIDHYTIQKQN